MEVILGALREDVARARDRVWIATYIYRDDRLGRSFADELARAVDRGVDVRLLYDALGSNKTSASFFRLLRARGIHARAYRPLDVVLQNGMWPREHSRLIVVDGAAYTGGAAWGDEWLPQREGGKGWHEVCCRVEGPCVEDFRRAFARRWSESLRARGGNEVWAYATGSKYDDVELVTDSPEKRNLVFERHRERVRSATKRVWMENAYFCPPRLLLDDLFAAAARGVDVRVIVPGDTDLPSIRRAARADYAQWIDRGVALYEYAPTILHAKFALVDDDWATVGTFNANPTSLRWANEANLFVNDAEFAREAEREFLADLAVSRRVEPRELARRPALEGFGDRAWRAVIRWLEREPRPLARLAPPEPAAARRQHARAA